jgi:hypothetical protein
LILSLPGHGCHRHKAGWHKTGWQEPVAKGGWQKTVRKKWRLGTTEYGQSTRLGLEHQLE